MYINKLTQTNRRAKSHLKQHCQLSDLYLMLPILSGWYVVSLTTQ